MLRQTSTLVEAANGLVVNEGAEGMPDFEASRQLALICKWFDDRLDELPRVTVLQSGVRRVELFEIIAWIVDENARHIDYGVFAEGKFRSYKIWFSVLSPIAGTPYSLWLRDIFNRVFATHEGYGGSSKDIAAQRYRWVLPTISDLLLGNAKFLKLSETLLPAALALPREVVDLALYVEQRPADTLFLRSMEFNRVWRCRDAFGIVARDAPNLLRLFAILHWQALSEFASPDPVLSLKRLLKAQGLSEATWRYVVRQGPDFLGDFWEVFREPYSQPDHTIAYLLCLQAAKLPPPPQREVIRLLGAYHKDNFGGALFMIAIPPSVVGAAIIEGNRRNQADQLDSFAEELQDVLWWSGTLKEPMAKNQRKAGWPWLLRRTSAYLQLENQIASSDEKTWSPSLPATEIDGYEVYPLDTAEKLIRAGFAMRNCLAECIEDSATGKAEYYAVQKSRLGKDRYCIGFKFDEDGATVSGVKGFANGSAPEEANRVAEELLRRLREAQSSNGRPHSCLPHGR